MVIELIFCFLVYITIGSVTSKIIRVFHQIDSLDETDYFILGSLWIFTLPLYMTYIIVLKINMVVSNTIDNFIERLKK